MDVSVKIEKRERKTWKTGFDFILNVMGMMIGLGNVWRFPYLCYKNGGGAFLIPYLIVMLMVAWPLIVMESAIGQKCGHSVVKAWNIVPLAKGIGYASPVLMLLANTFYPIVLTWALRWLIASFSPTLPWTRCDNAWNTENCLETFSKVENMTSLNLTDSDNAVQPNLTQSSVEEFWRREILGMTSGVEEVGGIKWDLLGCLFIIWVMVYFAVWKGINWTSKIVYVTATLPLAMMIVVAVRGVTLEGAEKGIEFYLKPNISKLQEIQIWSDATSQVMYSCCVAVGLISTLSGYNRYNHNFYRDSIILVVSNSCASFVAGFSIFSVLGYLAHAKNTSIADVAETGPGLVFAAYPTALSLLPLPQLWSAFFFVMIIFLGFDGQFVVQETLISCLKDLFPWMFNRKWGRELVVCTTCVMMFLPGISMVTRVTHQILPSIYADSLISSQFPTRHQSLCYLAFIYSRGGEMDTYDIH